MSNTLQIAERIGLCAYAGAFAVLPVLADHGVISEWIVGAIGVVSTAVVAAWKGGKIVTTPSTTPTLVASPDAPVI